MSLENILKKELEAGGQRLLGSEIECTLPVREEVVNASQSDIQVALNPDSYFELSCKLSGENRIYVDGWIPDAIDPEIQEINLKLNGLAYGSSIAERPAVSTNQVNVRVALKQISALGAFQRYFGFLDFLKFHTEESKLWINLKLTVKENKVGDDLFI